MIKILHYCWFGGKPLPDKYLKYIESWKKFVPDFELKRWDESNFDIESVPFVHDAYRAGKWAFVSDYVRFYALYHYGGLYLDTDVEIIKDFHDLMTGSLLGFESMYSVAPGLIIYADAPHLEFYKILLDKYHELKFDAEKVMKYQFTSPAIITDLLVAQGLVLNNTLQTVNGITIYPSEYFNPIGADFANKPQITENTRTIHHFEASWFDKKEKQLFDFRKKYGSFGGRLLFGMIHPIFTIKKVRRKK